MNIIALSQSKAEATPGHRDVHIISIRSPGNRPATLDVGFGRATYIEMTDSNAPEHAAICAVVDAAERARGAQAAQLIVQCEMGLSRSVGAARGIAFAFGEYFDHRFPGNHQVRRQIVAECARREVKT